MAFPCTATRRISVLAAQALSTSDVTPPPFVVLVWSLGGAEHDMAEVLQALCRDAGVSVDVRLLPSACGALFPPFHAQSEAAAKLTDAERKAVVEELRRACRDSDAWLGWPGISWDSVASEIGGWPSKLRWIQTISAGTDLLMKVVPDHIIVTRAAGKFDRSIAEWVLTWMLMHCKNVHRFMQSQQDRTWRVQPQGIRQIRGANVLVVGYGSIGQQIANLCSAVGARVVATRRSASSMSIEGCAEVHPASSLHSLLPSADFVVISMPLTKATKASFGAPELEVMRENAALINIARGELVDWVALRSALHEGRLSAYYTDVMTPEPFPAGHPDWTIPNLHITPHITWTPRPDLGDDARRFFGNLRRFLAGDDLSGVVDRSLGY